MLERVCSPRQTDLFGNNSRRKEGSGRSFLPFFVLLVALTLGFVREFNKLGTPVYPFSFLSWASDVYPKKAKIKKKEEQLGDWTVTLGRGTYDFSLRDGIKG